MKNRLLKEAVKVEEQRFHLEVVLKALVKKLVLAKEPNESNEHMHAAVRRLIRTHQLVPVPAAKCFVQMNGAVLLVCFLKSPRDN
ncbi:hypothetical protein MTO96_029300 [Rhipicephalus appendiculatus]